MAAFFCPDMVWALRDADDPGRHQVQMLDAVLTASDAVIRGDGVVDKPCST